MTIVCWGDSETGAMPCEAPLRFGATTPLCSKGTGIEYPKVLEILRHLPEGAVVNKGMGGAHIGDLSQYGYLNIANMPVSGDIWTLMIFTNDVLSYQSMTATAGELALAKMQLGALCSFTVGNKKGFRTDLSWQPSEKSAWAPNTFYDSAFGGIGSWGKSTKVHGDVVTAKFFGAWVHLVYTIFDGCKGVLDLYVDDVLIDTIACGPPAGTSIGPLSSGKTYCPVLYSASGFNPAIEHTLRIVCRAGAIGDTFAVEWISDSGNGAALHLLSSPPIDAAKLPNGGKIAAYNDVKRVVAEDFALLGLNVGHDDVCRDLDPVKHLLRDGGHMNSLAHVIVGSELDLVIP